MPQLVSVEGLPVRPAAMVRRCAEYQYILDSATELGEITPLEHAVFMRDTTAGEELDTLLRQNLQLPNHFLRNVARAYLNSLPTEVRHLWALRSIEGFDFALKALQERIEHVVQTKVQRDLGLKDSTPQWLWEFSEASEPQKLFHDVHDICPDKVLGYVSALYQESKQMLEADIEEVRQAMLWLSQPGNVELARKLAKAVFPDMQVPSLQHDTVRSLVRNASKVRVKERRRQARGAIKKALNLLNSFGMQKDVQMLISGHEVVISHPESPFKFEVKALQAGWLENKTVDPGRHVPFQLSLLTKDDIFLTRLCVLFDSTPVLDQLLALTLFVQSGNEKELLNKANWFGMADVERVRTILEERSPDLTTKLPRYKDSSGVGPGESFERLHAQWQPYRAPVMQWLTGWFSHLIEDIRSLEGHRPLLA